MFYVMKKWVGLDCLYYYTTQKYKRALCSTKTESMAKQIVTALQSLYDDWGDV